MRRVAQSVLVAVAIVCALALSASSTVALAAGAGVPGWAHPAAVGLLEVASVAGTWIWMTDARLRAEAAAVVLVASAVTGVGGVIAYGWFGVVAPLGLVITVHLMARAWSEPGPDRSAEPGPAAQLDVVAEPEPDAPTETAPDLARPPVPPTSVAPRPVVRLSRSDEAVLVDRLAADARTGVELPTNRELVRQHGVGRERAGRIRAAAERAAARPDLRAVRS